MSDREEYTLSEGVPPISHYTDAVRFRDTLYISGLAPVDSNHKVVSDDPAEQTRCIFEQMKAIMALAGADFSDVLRVTVYLTDVNDRTAINPVRQEYFGDTLPASTLIGVSELAIPGMKVEIEAIVGLKR
ncbi:RidA family protein [Pikeienuella piscinae]|uniref:RidA family protein n=1 Tax=Pikeienuella piscinae TaxID=2748098 RepID=A0A7L5BV40_9RHOB|nr:RidA family protein [Pikeienuella piscinae]QIE55211.1 RidA family protein [Pikeienuella piscinae]